MVQENCLADSGKNNSIEHFLWFLYVYSRSVLMLQKMSSFIYYLFLNVEAKKFLLFVMPEGVYYFGKMYLCFS